MNTHYKSAAFEAIHETAQGLHRCGAIDKITMREFDDTCLHNVVAFAPEEIRHIREQEHLTQPAFASYLSVSKNRIPSQVLDSV